MEKTKGRQIRSRVKWIEEGEKNTAFFLGLEINFSMDLQYSLFSKILVFSFQYPFPLLPLKSFSFKDILLWSVNFNTIGLMSHNDILSKIETKKIYQSKKFDKPVHNLKSMIKSHKLIDIWRQKNKTKTQFTCF
jgi:hypothetical protein